MSKNHREFPSVGRTGQGDSRHESDRKLPRIGLEELVRELEAFGPIYIDTPPIPPKSGAA